MLDKSARHYTHKHAHTHIHALRRVRICVYISVDREKTTYFSCFLLIVRRVLYST